MYIQEEEIIAKIANINSTTLKGLQWILTMLYHCWSIIHLELEEKYEKKMQALRDELELRRKTEIHEIEEVSTVDFMWVYFDIILAV